MCHTPSRCSEPSSNTNFVFDKVKNNVKHKVKQQLTVSQTLVKRRSNDAPRWSNRQASSMRYIQEQDSDDPALLAQGIHSCRMSMGA